jgi:predicted NAD/FAD-binding protein
MPPHRRAWAAWNYERRGTDQGQATLTYDMTTLQHLPGKQRYLVSLNSDEFIDEHQVIARFQYHHPVYDLQAIRAQQALAGLQGQNHTYFCGAWCGNGFHEDGVASALNVCAALGVPW